MCTTLGLLLVDGLLLVAEDLALEFGLGQQVEMLFLPVETLEAEPETAATQEGNDGDSGVEPHEERVVGKTGKGLTKSGGDGRGELVETKDERTHVGRGLGVRVLETRDGGKDLSETDENIGASLGPDVDGSSRVVAGVHVLTALASLVDVVLDDGGPNHGGAGDEETGSHTLEGRESDLCLAKSWVDDEVEDRNHDDDTKRVHVVKEIVGHAVELHGSSLGGQVAVNLVVCEPKEWVEQEHAAGFDTTGNFVNPSIVKGHPGRLVGNLGWLHILPEVVGLQVAPGRDWVCRDLALGGVLDQLCGLAKNGASWGT